MSFVISNKRQCYRYTTTNGLLIKDAAELCQKNGGKLPIPKSQEEQDLLINMLNNKIPKKVHFPIDLQLNNFNTYVMSNGKEPTWTKWFPGQPKGNGKQKFVQIGDYGSPLWLDLSPTEPVYDIVCQQVCSSGTLTLAVFKISNRS